MVGGGGMTPEQWRSLVGVALERERGRESVRSIARRAGVSEGLWRHLESGRRPLRHGQFETVKPKGETVLKVCRVLGWTDDSIDRLLVGMPPERLLDPERSLVDQWAEARPGSEYTAEIGDALRAARPTTMTELLWIVDSHSAPEVVERQIRAEVDLVKRRLAGMATAIQHADLVERVVRLEARVATLVEVVDRLGAARLGDDPTPPNGATRVQRSTGRARRQAS